VPFKNSRVIGTWARPSGTCISARRRWKRPSGSWNVANPLIVEPAGRRRELRPEMPGTGRKIGGGGGSRTRVRRHAIEGLYMRVRF
jgi:hypothetical protein